jgi:NO-binding membrane sensor protein with MHYT domain
MPIRSFSLREMCGASSTISTWDLRLVLLSIVFAVAGSYLALDFAGRMRSSTSRRDRGQWFISGAAMMGLAIWSMHFVGMIALKLPIPVTYDWRLSLFSMLAAAAGAGLAFDIMNRRAIGRFHLFIGSLAMGIAIAGMHYIGMASMEMAATIHYQLTLFILSVLIAILASAGALALAYFFNKPNWSLLWFKAGSAVIMGGAISGMHYVGMAAACYLPTGGLTAGLLDEPTVGAFNLRDILVSAGVVFGLALLLLNAYTAVERQRALDSYARLNEELERKVQERTAQLQASNRELATFSYTVSHDLRAPLRAIAGFSQILLDRYFAQIDQTGHNYLERIRNSTSRMGQLIDGLLNLSRVTQTPLEPQTIDLSALAESIVAELRVTNPERQVVVIIPPGLTARADPSLLGSVLQNLLGNAWKFTARQERAEIEFASLIQDKQTVFFVRDNGVGFDMSYANKLFGVFERLHHVGDFQGTGIGLATVKRILERHGGTIWADAQVGRGATMYFTLPSL